MTAIFDTPLSGDGIAEQDYDMENGGAFDAIWAHAPIAGGQAQSHTTASTARGTYWMQLSYLRNAASATQMMSVIVMVISCSCAVFM